ncbi:DNA/RNA non-specific endonuclease [Marinobacter salinisoli]|uniref:Endonuclease n=1 Tax=Marinobacter salinisoli TaxID=2769486 RepID=A0ABX7MNP3_9GAMM|nr:DNA/RNA non-specific endonuclease [Marinobacter salinisoli]QSP93897.1 DNA/RNA non-specific endonuclease [Marinobacter salinisoli]
MNDPFQMQPELRYGAPVCDEILTGRHFTIGYSYYFRQAKWTLEIINRNEYLLTETERFDNFRADTRVPTRFRAGLSAYKGSGYDRGHLVASANQDIQEIQNSETFLLSNMSPQQPGFNRHIWRRLEFAIRDLNNRDDILETYVLTAPVFYFGIPIETIGSADDDYGIYIPVPHGFIKSVLAEDRRGKLSLWTFEMKNESLQGGLGEYLVSTYDAEQMIGGRFWDRVSGEDLHQQKKKPRPMW